jgi:hypothetical protein
MLFDVAHGGGIFRSVTAGFKSMNYRALSLVNLQTIMAFGLRFSVPHPKVIKYHEDGY